MREAALRGLLDGHLRPIRLQEGLRAGRSQDTPQTGAGPACGRRDQTHLRHGTPGQELPRHRQGPQRRGRRQPQGQAVLKSTIHTTLNNEAYTGAVVWGVNAKDGAPPVRVEKAHPALVSSASSGRSPGFCAPALRRAYIPGVPPAPTCSAVSSSARRAARPSQQPRPRAANTPTTSVTPCSRRAGVHARPPGSTPRTSRALSSPTSGRTSSQRATSETWSKSWTRRWTGLPVSSARG